MNWLFDQVQPWLLELAVPASPLRPRFLRAWLAKKGGLSLAEADKVIREWFEGVADNRRSFLKDTLGRGPLRQLAFQGFGIAVGTEVAGAVVRKTRLK